MTTLEALFAHDQRTARVDDGIRRDDGSALAEVVGPRRQATPPTRVNTDTTRLVALVDAAERDASPVLSGAPGAPTKGRRRIRRIDWINVSAAVLALVVVVGTIGFAGVRAASASPATVASEALAADRAALASAERGMNAALERLNTLIADGKAQATAARTAIAGLDETVVDSAARSAAVAAADAYLASLDGVVLPPLPEPYAAASVDEESLSAVAAALDEVRERSAEVDDAVVEIRNLRTSVEQSSTGYLQALSAFASTFPARAAVEVDVNSSAEQEFRDAVTTAAASLAGAPLNEAGGQQALIAYQDAVLALREDEERALIEAEERAAIENDRGNRGESDGDSGTTPPATETPVDPTTPTDPTVPTEPVVPAPDPGEEPQP
ncbi:hypothetical protein [Microbacterium sp. 3J1]|uniref:hypothetical protein n=1 Tax=Microbacterium sp. 3J1 TaxID=861269 RepID=UPI000ACA21F4|nr:hypothetical protein [Microbacterium sp. 3J1]